MGEIAKGTAMATDIVASVVAIDTIQRCWFLSLAKLFILDTGQIQLSNGCSCLWHYLSALLGKLHSQ